MPRLGDMFPTKWLGANDLKDRQGDFEELVLTIDRLVEEEIGQDRQLKWVLYFTDHKKGLVLNKTNTTTIAKLYGDDTDDWEGCKVTLFVTEVSFQGDQVEAIRIRSKPPKGKKTLPIQAVNEEEFSADNPPF